MITKKTKTVRVIAFGQLLVGIGFACACFGGVLFPYLGVIDSSGKEYLTTTEQREKYQEQFDSVLNAYFSLNEDSFWDSFVTLQVYDLQEFQNEISFCITKNYRFWGISLGNLEDVEEVRYVVDSEGNINTRETDLDLGVICTRSR